MNSSKKVFILGVNGFPYGSARIEKLKQIGSTIQAQNVNVHFICNSWGLCPDENFEPYGFYNEIQYSYVCGITNRPKSFFKRRYYNTVGKIKEIIFLLTNKCDAAIVSVTSGMFFSLFKYWIISRINGYKIYYPYHEEENVSLKNGNVVAKVNLFFYNKYGLRVVDGIFPVSSFLESRIKQMNKRLSILKIPPITDFSYFDSLRKKYANSDVKYFLFCGSIVYYEVIEFIINAFEQIDNKEYELHIVSFGSKEKEPALKMRIAGSSKSSLIKQFGYLDYQTLALKYIKAKGLLIPLRDTVQDTARFPHKICEYTASQSPIITTCVGEIKQYFKDKHSALIASDYCITSFARKMNYVIENPEHSKEIGKNGYQLGIANFDYKSYGKKIMEVLNQKN